MLFFLLRRLMEYMTAILRLNPEAKKYDTISINEVVEKSLELLI